MILNKNIFVKSSLFLLLASSNINAALYDMPFKGEDFKSNEKVYRGKKIHSESGSQKYGYDLTGIRYDKIEKRWSTVKIDVDDHWDNPINSNYVIFGKPVFAMADGVIEKCWRNAPSNPRPKLPDEDKDEIAFEDREWLHWAYRQKRMHNGGNHLQMRLADGNIIRYSHFKKGSISIQLCPNNATLYSTSNADSERNVPKNQQVSVKRGQFLGFAGNNGNSTGPHLHVHVQSNGGTSKKIKFRRGLAAAKDDSQANINNWTKFAGKQIPEGPVLIWPPRTVRAEYARHGYPQTNFQGLFTHLADSGYKLAWLDGYGVNGKPFYNMIWRPKNISWRAYYGQSSGWYQNRINQAKQDGYVPTQVDVHTTSAGVRYNVIFEKKNVGWRARHNRSYAQHINDLNIAKSLGMSPVNIAVVSVNNQRRYTTLYHKKSIGSWVMRSQLSSNAYQNKVVEQKNKGRSPVYVNSYKHNGKVYYTAVFASKPGGTWRAKHGLTSSGYQSQWAYSLGKGYLTNLVAGIDNYHKHRFAAIWRK